MSLSLIIIPIALAAVSVVAAARAETGESNCSSVVVGTRMRNEQLLCQSLAQLGATVSRTVDSIAANWPQGQAKFRKDSQGIWSAHFSGSFDYERAASLIVEIDTAYAALVQQEVLSRLRERAPSLGMSIESENVEEDLSVTLVLNVQVGDAA